MKASRIIFITFVILSIVIILIGLLMPSLQQVRKQARDVSARALQRQLQLMADLEGQSAIELLGGSADEIWVIAKPETSSPASKDETPGSGAMLAKLPKQEKEVPLPLKHTDVKGDICGYIATVEVTQQFHNPYSEKIEARYVFPLPQNAAVNEFIMIIGDRKIRGIIIEFTTRKLTISFFI